MSGLVQTCAYIRLPTADAYGIPFIRVMMATTQSRQKSYTDVKRRELTFEEGDLVCLKVSPMKEVKRFGLKEKLSPRYIGPYQVMERVGSVAYRVVLPTEYKWVHDMFHVSSLRKSFKNQ